ncbi:hypothetical protein LCGC14_2097180 [marine sediment metagenome]|uniref:Uncharacterized protein n=1 Tax=marine sediment metagenome TaxID=412755 RepID=A0A0F9GP77_9ZZZZ
MIVTKIVTVHPVHQPDDVKYIFVGENERLGEAGQTLKKGTYYEGRAGRALRVFLETL